MTSEVSAEASSPSDAPAPRGAAAWGDSARRIAALAWPVLIGQLSVLAFGTVDTLLLARHTPEDLAALAVGSAAYITVFIGFMGVVVAISPIAGQLFGAGQHAQAGRQAHQAIWVALGMSVLGCALLAFPGAFIVLSRVGPEVEAKVRSYLMVLALSLPASLLFTVFRGFNTAVSRPKAVMVLQLIGLGVKVPVSTALAWGLPGLGLPALGLLGCGIATAVAMWVQLALAWQVIKRDRFYAPFQLTGRRLDAPDRRALRTHLALGLPMGGSILVEVTGFSFMALFVAQLGTTVVGGHQIAVSVVTLMFMVPLAIGNACTTLVAQSVGARDALGARRLAWHGLALGCAVSGLLGVAASLGRESIVGWYTDNAAVAAAALPLMAWVALFHLADAAQTIAAFVLRAWRIATVPLVIYAAALWGVGLAGGHVFAFDLLGGVPSWMQGARGFWIASTSGLVLASLALIAYLAWVLHRQPSAGPRPTSERTRPHP